MIAELKEVLQKVEQLDEGRQKLIVKLITDELEWEDTLNNTQENLSALAKEAIEEYQSGKTKQQGW